MLKTIWLRYRLRRAKRRHEDVQFEIRSRTADINALPPESHERVLINREVKNLLFPTLREAQDEIQRLEAQLGNR